MATSWAAATTETISGIDTTKQQSTARSLGGNEVASITVYATGNSTDDLTVHLQERNNSGSTKWATVQPFIIPAGDQDARNLEVVLSPEWRIEVFAANTNDSGSNALEIEFRTVALNGA